MRKANCRSVSIDGPPVNSAECDEITNMTRSRGARVLQHKNHRALVHVLFTLDQPSVSRSGSAREKQVREAVPGSPPIAGVRFRCLPQVHLTVEFLECNYGRGVNTTTFQNRKSELLNSTKFRHDFTHKSLIIPPPLLKHRDSCVLVTARK